MPRRTWILVAALLLLGAFFFFQYYSIADIRTGPSEVNTYTPPEQHQQQQCAPVVSADSADYPTVLSKQKTPTGGSITLRLHQNLMEPATPAEDKWNFAVISTMPNVFIVTEENMVPQIQGHYQREHYIYKLMKWILRVYRKDQGRILRNEPLLMIDAGSNHGLFSMVAGVSGAYVVAFEPQTHLRNVIGYGARLNQIDQYLRILPFAVLDKFTKVSISNYEIGDGGIAFLDFNRQSGPIQTQTIRLDHMPSFDRLFPALGPNALGPHDASFSDDYASYLKKAHDLDPEVLPMLTPAEIKKLLLRQPIHFLKIDVEGFELRALESASTLYEAGLIEHTVLEFGAPHRWVVTESKSLSAEEVKARTLAEAKLVLNKAARDWNLDIYLLPSIGWENCREWMTQRLTNVDGPADGVHMLKAWDLGGSDEQDAFDEELKGNSNLVTPFIKLPADMIDDFLNDLESTGEVYLWMAKKGGASAVLKDAA